AVTSGTGIAQITSNLQSPLPGTLLSGDPGTIFSTPVKISVSSFFPGGPVAGAEIRAVADPAFPATAACTNAVLTDATGDRVCNLRFGSTSGAGKVRFFVGGNYDVYGPYSMLVGPGTGNPGSPGNPGTPSGPSLTANPSSLSFVYPGTLTQNVSVTS